MTEPQFTPGPWHKSTFEDDYAIRGAKCNRIIARPNCNFDDASANAALIAQCPSLYANEEKNLKSLKTLLHFVEMITKSCDMNPVMRITALAGIVDTKERIETTEQLLAKCRGEVKDE